ncbi:hypothetical protein NDU88_003956 [Pleurodeles waltl]|uniref:Uncharacterized protein n=1 Tax=Pleurodeles waltl TaxID=8319 RepID=A0AAV7QB62_PLEWA|nr:hypothetical protein NDU88_003956 [Pleurodeles waltl]
MVKHKKCDEPPAEDSSPTGNPLPTSVKGLQAGHVHHETTLDTVLHAIKESREALERKIDNLTTDLSLLRDDHRKLKETVGPHESALAVVSTVQKASSSELIDLATRLKTLEARAEGAENQARRNNIRLVGVPEGAESIAVKRTMCGRQPGIQAMDWSRKLDRMDGTEPM